MIQNVLNEEMINNRVNHCGGCVVPIGNGIQLEATGKLATPTVIHNPPVALYITGTIWSTRRSHGASERASQYFTIPPAAFQNFVWTNLTLQTTSKRIGTGLSYPKLWVCFESLVVGKMAQFGWNKLWTDADPNFIWSLNSTLLEFRQRPYGDVAVTFAKRMKLVLLGTGPGWYPGASVNPESITPCGCFSTRVW